MAALLLLLALAPAHAAAPDCLAFLRSRVDAVRRASFPDLAGEDLRVDPLESARVRGQSQPRPDWRHPGRLVYVVQLNESLCADVPPPAALDALIAHELSHVADYRRRSALSLLRLGALYLLAPQGDAVAAYERATDEAALRAGYGEGLRQYRVWLASRQSPDDAALWRRLYLTPEEIGARLKEPR